MQTTRPAAIPRVAVLVDTSTSWGRRVHTGIHAYDRAHGPWQLFVDARGLEEKLRVPQGWRGDGIIARIGNVTMAKELAALHIPVVNVSGIQVRGAAFPRVTTDLTASGQLAAKHFLDRGYRHFAYFSLLGLSYVTRHQQAFADASRDAGGDFAWHAVKPGAGADPDWNLDLAKLGDWLARLSKPVGILTWNASSAREIFYACQVRGLLVPEQVAVLSGSDDELLCEILQVPISGIRVASERIGFEAAELLDHLMRRRRAPRKEVLIAPQGVVTRQSTDTLAISDKALVKAVSFIRQNAAGRVRVSDVARQAGMSRRVLERCFAGALNRSPAEEIRRVRVERAKRLLADTDLPIPDIAEAAGFSSPEYLAYAIRKVVGMTPRAYREEERHR